MKKMLGRTIAISMIAALMLLIILLQTTTPATIGPLGILVILVLIYVLVLGVLTFLLFWINRFLVRMSPKVVVRRPLQPLSLGRAYYFSSVLALAPVMLIGMQSVGNVGLADVILIVVFIAITCVYITKRSN